MVEAAVSLVHDSRWLMSTGLPRMTAAVNPRKTAERGCEVGGQRGQAIIMVCGPAVRTVPEYPAGWRPKVDY